MSTIIGTDIFIRVFKQLLSCINNNNRNNNNNNNKNNNNENLYYCCVEHQTQTIYLSAHISHLSPSDCVVARQFANSSNELKSSSTAVLGKC